MLKNLFRAVLVFRLEFRQPAFDFTALISYWQRAPLIQYVIEDEREKRGCALMRKLDKVYPF